MKAGVGRYIYGMIITLIVVIDLIIEDGKSLEPIILFGIFWVLVLWETK